MHESRYVSTARVAQALGVGVTSIKRWVDEGVLPAHKTAGGHRKILLGDVLRLIRALKLPCVDIKALTAASPPELLAPEELSEQFAEALAHDDQDAARALLLGAYQAGMTVDALADNVIAPVMARIGHDWETGLIDVMDEHRISQLCLAAVHALKQRIDQGVEANRPIAVGGGPEGDHYQLPSLLAQMTLAANGWEAINIGPNTPMASVARALKTWRPRLLWLSCSHLADPERLIAEYAGVRRQAEKFGAKIAIGGSALAPELRKRLPAALHGETLRQLIDLADTLHPARSARRRSKVRRD